MEKSLETFSTKHKCWTREFLKHIFTPLKCQRVFLWSVAHKFSIYLHKNSWNTTLGCASSLLLTAAAAATVSEFFPRPPKGRGGGTRKAPIFRHIAGRMVIFVLVSGLFVFFFLILRKQAPKWIHCEQVEHCSTQQSIRICSLKGSTRGGKLKLKKLVQWRVYLATRVCV